MFSQEGHNILKLATDSNGVALRDEDGNFYHTTAKVTKICVIFRELLYFCNAIRGNNAVS